MKHAKSQSEPSAKKHYHHGDLGNSLVQAATDMLLESGIEGLSLRKLADRVGVSRTAPYHHFKDKNALLCAIAKAGFERWQVVLDDILKQPELSEAQKYRAMVKAYLHYAAEHQEIYELMFGRTIWKSDSATPDLKSVAYPCFQAHVELVRQWQHKGVLAQNEDSLRLAQVSWATMHGLARLLIDGVYADVAHLDEMCDCLVNSFIRQDIKTG